MIDLAVPGRPPPSELPPPKTVPPRARTGCTTEQLDAWYGRHFKNTGRYLQIWGELGEIYAEITVGLRRHGTHHPGSDGTIAGKLVEVKTISPEKGNDHVLVKRQGDFEQLLIVRIDKDFQFTGKLVDRSSLLSGGTRFLRTSAAGT